MEQLAFIIVEFISLCCYFRSRLVDTVLINYIDNTTIIYIICVVTSIALLLSFKIDKIGYVTKVIVSGITAYEGIVLLNDIISYFVHENNILFVKIILFFTGTAIIAILTFKMTKFTWLESDYEIDTFYIRCFFTQVAIKINDIRMKKLSSINGHKADKKKYRYRSKKIKLIEENELLKTENQKLKEKMDQLEALKDKEILSLRCELNRAKSNNKKEIDDRIFFVNCDQKHEIKERFRKLSKIYHPDCMGGDTDIYVRIKKVYDNLC